MKYPASTLIVHRESLEPFQSEIAPVPHKEIPGRPFPGGRA
ncbi:hypothetical protein [Nonomuraea typhae]|nr:hypothetical protein [Nonomuraea typhae]